MGIEIIKVTAGLFEEKFEEFILLRNYISSFHSQSDSINEFNRRKMEELVSYLEQQKAYVYGAFDIDKLVGFIWGYQREFFYEKRMFINSLVVAKDYSKMGLGRKLIDTLKDFANNELSCEAIDVTVFPGNQNAMGFYEHLGFKPERIQMRVGI